MVLLLTRTNQLFHPQETKIPDETEGGYWTEEQWILRTWTAGVKTEEALCLWKWDGSEKISGWVGKLEGQAILRFLEVIAIVNLEDSKVALIMKREHLKVAQVNPTAYCRPLFSRKERKKLAANSKA